MTSSTRETKDKDERKKPDMPINSPFLIANVLLFGAVFAMLYLFPTLSPRHDLSYGEFKSLLAAGEVSECVLEESVIRGVLDSEFRLDGVSPPSEGGGISFRVTRTEDPDLIRELVAAEVDFRAERASPWIQTIAS